MQEIDYDKLASAIAKKLKPTHSPVKIIWTPKQCAEHLGISDRHFVDRVSKAHNFPAPIKLPSSPGRRGHARWYAEEVQAWVAGQK